MSTREGYALPAPRIPLVVPTPAVLDRLEVGLLAYLFVTLPFAVSDWLPILRVANRSLFLIAGVVAAWSLLAKHGNRITLGWTFFGIALLFFHTAVGLLHSESLYMVWDIVKEQLNLFTALALIFWSRTVRSTWLPRVVVWTSLFFSLDVIVQRLVGVDFFGLSPFGDRFWGVFLYGAPTFGVFITTVFFVPWFHLERLRTKVLVTAVFTIALLLANDRAPIPQMFLALILFAPFGLLYKLLLGGVLTGGFYYVFSLHPDWLPSRIRLLLSSIQVVLVLGPARIIGGSGPDVSLLGYIQKWQAVIGGWFTWENWYNVLFGAGWGATHYVLIPYAGISRPHSTYLELVITFGIIGFAILAMLVLRLYLRNRDRFILLAPIILPFAFFSIFSANWIFLGVIAYLMFEWAPRRRELDRSERAPGVPAPAPREALVPG